MSTHLPPLTGVELRPAGVAAWDQVVPLIRMPDNLMLLAGFIRGHAVLAGAPADADADAGIRIRPDLALFASLVGADEGGARGMLAALCDEYGLLEPVGDAYRFTLPADATERFGLDSTTHGDGTRP